jgi:PKD repeat protein
MHWQSSSPTGYTSSGIHTATITALEPVTEYEYRPILTYDRGQVTGDVHTLNTRDTIANFIAAPVEGVAPLTVTFAAAAEPPATYLWDFGDQVTSTLRSPVHTYTAVGFYTATLTVSTTVQSATLSRVEYISVWEDQIHLPLVLRNH